MCREAISERTRMKKGNTPSVPCVGQCAQCKMPFMPQDVTERLIIVCPGCGYEEPYKSVINWKRLWMIDDNN